MALTKKQCSGCLETKPLNDFHRDRHKPDGRCTQCKVCKTEAVKRYRAENNDSVTARQRARYWANRELMRERNRENYQKHREARLAYQREYKQTPGYWERFAVWQQRWRECHPEQYREIVRNKNHRRRGAAPDATAREYIEILGGDPCAYCGGKANTIDHIDAIHHGGDGDWSNLTAACGNCNYRKNTKSLLSFLAA